MGGRRGRPGPGVWAREAAGCRAGVFIFFLGGLGAGCCFVVVVISVVTVFVDCMGWGSSVGLHAERGSRARGAWRRGCLVLTGVAASRRTLGSAFPRLTRSLTWMVDTEASLCRRGGVRLQRWGVAVSGIEGPFTGSGGLRWAGFARLMVLLTRSRRRRAPGTRPRSVSHGIGWRTKARR